MLGVGAPPPLTDRELAQIVQLVYEKSGITLHDGKRALVAARLQKQIRAGNFPSFSAYLRHVEADGTGQELSRLLDAIATNHTSFFREPQHFEFLRTQILETGRGRRLSLWSAACATGEEPFTLAISVLESQPGATDLSVRILASDLSTKALAVARAGVYKLDRVSSLPREVLRKYFEKGLGAQDGLARVAPQVQRLVEFRQLNLLEVDLPGERFDVIFCRNVMIYFDKAVQQRVVARLERHLAPGGYLFISHSESLNGIAHGLQWVAPAVYRKGAA